MSGKPDPGSYTINDEPFDTYGATKVPLRTPHGPLTLTFTGAGHVACDAGYVTTEWGHSANYSEGEWFAWDGIEVAGSAHFYAEDNWTTRDSLTHLYSRGGSVTARRGTGIVAYWSEIVRRYVAEHPHIPAHAGLREAVKSLGDQDEAIHEAEQKLAGMRKTRAAARREVRRAFVAEHTLRAAEGLDEPRPYAHETVSGYVTELANDADLINAIQASRKVRESYAAS